LNNIATILADQAVLEQQDREKRETETSSMEMLGDSEGLLKMLESSPGNDDFRGGRGTN
jgi:hypothetical protein